MRIDSIERRRKRLAAVTVEGTTLLLDLETVAAQGLKAGDELSESALETLQYKSELNRAKNKALWLISLREYPKHELTTKLSRDFEPTAAQEAVQLLCDTGLVDDERFARLFIEDAINLRGLSRRAVSGELRRRGVDRELTEALIDEYETDELPVIKRLIQDRYADYSADDKRRARMYSALLRRGYGYGDINRAINELEEQTNVD